MLNSLYNECVAFPPLAVLLQPAPTWVGRLDGLYLAFVSLVFLLDSALFCFGYHAEAGFLKNEVRYVETTVSGILVCVVCYPPFNNVTSMFLGSPADAPNILYRDSLYHPMTWVLRGLAVLFLLLLTSASFSLFTRASNLTNRGIVQYGPYRWVRHPGYVGKNLFWLMTLLPALLVADVSNPMSSWSNHLIYCLGRVAGFGAWCTIYILRALTEERLLMQDPDYVAYCQKVRYRFIPGVI
jgi:protein-S-isoprenylcysteine O-methyltransferase Ste14